MVYGHIFRIGCRVKDYNLFLVSLLRLLQIITINDQKIILVFIYQCSPYHLKHNTIVKSALKLKDPVLKPGLLIKFGKVIIEAAIPGLFYASRRLHNEYRKSPH